MDACALPPDAHPHPPAGGRGDGQRRRVAGLAAGIAVRDARYGNPTPLTSGIGKRSPAATAPRAALCS
jgi:hypothetical protein